MKMVPCGQISPTTKVHCQEQNKRSIYLLVYQSVFIGRRTYQSIQYTSDLLQTLIIAHLAANDVITFTAGEFALFILQSWTNVAALAP